MSIFCALTLLGADLGRIPIARAEEPLAEWLEGLAGAAQKQAHGDFAGAAAAARGALAARPAGEAAARSRLSLGIALAREHRFAEAARLLLAADPGLHAPLRQAARLRLGEALFYAGRPGAAAQVFALAASGGGPLGEVARWREADALLGAGLAARAARAYQSLLARSPRHPAAWGARLSMAAALRSVGAEAAALALYREVAFERAAGPEGAAAEEALRAWREAGGPVPELTREERLARAERLLQVGRPREALAALDELDGAGPAPGPRSALLRALALLQVGRPAEAELVASALLDRADSASERPAAELALARASARAGRTEEAARLYRRVAASRPRVPGLPAQQQAELPEEAAYLSAWLFYDAGDFARAAGLLDRYARDHPGSRRALDARWFRAWSLYRLGRVGAARRDFAALERTPLAAGALYWRARLTGEPARQVKLYRAAWRAAQGDWYGLLAAARLSALGQNPPAAPPPPAGPLPGSAPGADSARGMGLSFALAGAGLLEEGLLELRALSLGPRARVRAPFLAEAAAFLGDFEIPFRMARDHLLPTSRALRWGHPQAFPEVLRPAAAGAGVDPFLLLATMRRESSFRLDARSGAAAEGLLQLIPPTAERLATLLGVPLDVADRLGEPAVSIAFGAYYLGLLRARFSEVPVLLAAYNAGPGPVAAWATARAGLPLDEWVESIPYRETRQYVRRVTADWALYHSLHGAGRLPLDPAAPVTAPRPGVSF